VLPWLTVYSASKYAVGALTEGLRMELRRDGIRTMLVCPGYVLTEFQQRSVAKFRRNGEGPAVRHHRHECAGVSGAAWSATRAR